MESLVLEKENIIKDIRNLFRQEKETKAIKDGILRDIKNLSEHEKEEENYYEPVFSISCVQSHAHTPAHVPLVSCV